MAWTPDYVTLDQFKAYALRVSPADTIDDVEAQIAVTSASRAVDRFTRRQFGNTELESRLYTPEYDRASGRHIVRTDDIAEVGEGFLIEADVDGTADWVTVASSFAKLPLNAAANARPYERLTFPAAAALGTLEGSLRVTAVYGWAEVPAAVEQATLLQAARYFKRREAPFGTAGSPEMGTEIRLTEKVDVDLQSALRPYRLQVWA